MAATILTVKPKVVTGRYLAHNHLDPVSRAFIAADINTKSVIPTDFTLTQSAYLAHVNVTYAWWARRRLAEREAIEARFIPLVPQQHLMPRKNGSSLPMVVSADVDDAAVIDIVRILGTARNLEACVAVEAAQ